MSVIGSNILAGASGQGGGYTIDRSVRLRSSASAYLSRTFGTPTSGTTWTWSAWVKLGALGTNRNLFTAVSTGTANIQIQSNDTLTFYQYNAGYQYNRITTQVFRDPSAWYHLVCVYDSGNATASNRIRMYLNGVQITSFSSTTDPSLNYAGYLNASGQSHTIGGTSGAYFDGYLTEINFVDGQALTPSDFGEYDAVTGVWKAKKYVGTYGTNGFYLNFSDNTSTTTLGYDYSGNGNNWTANNISLTSGVTYDSMTDVPTLTSETAGNYAVLNPLSLGSTVTLSNANLTMTEGGTYATTVSSIAMTSGKWYAEMTVGSNTYAGTCGIARLGYAATSRLGFQANTWAYNSDGGLYYNSTQLTPTQATFTTGDVIGIAFDADNLTIQFYKNNALQSQYYTAANSGLTAGEFYFATGHINSTSNWNFGQRPFAFTPPTGFKALNTFNLPDSTIVDGSQYFDATIYTGNGTSQSIVNSGGMQPDLVWLKSRSLVAGHELVDSVRGTTKTLYSNLTNAEDTTSQTVTAFNANGFSVGADTGANSNAASQVGWQWKANGTAVSNTDGSITSSVSANTTSGFSIVTYTGIAGNVAKTFGHGLNVAPSMVIIKPRTTASAFNAWVVWHSAFTGSEYIYLDLTIAKGTSANYWGATVPSSTVVTVGGNSSNVSNESGITYVAYCFAEVPGFSKFGSYTGNGSADGVFVYLGFRPRWILIKNASAAEPWNLVDTSRNPYNVMANYLQPNSSGAEGSITFLDGLSNGFKLRSSAAAFNGSGNTMIYAAFAETDFAHALAR